MANRSAMKVLKTNQVKKPSSMKAMKATNSSPKNAPSTPKKTLKASSSMKAPTPYEIYEGEKGWQGEQTTALG